MFNIHLETIQDFNIKNLVSTHGGIDAQTLPILCHKEIEALFQRRIDPSSINILIAFQNYKGGTTVVICLATIREFV